MNPFPSRSTWQQAFATYFLTNLLGTAMVLVIIGGISDAGSSFILPTGVIALLSSALFVPVACLTLRWTLAMQQRLLRIATSLLAIGGFFGLAAILIKLFGSDLYKFIQVGLPYLPASLVVYVIVYRKALFRSSE